jgi:hypothetical protein
VLTRHTDPEIEARQVQIWRGLSSIEIAEVIVGAIRTARALSLAGLRARYPVARLIVSSSPGLRRSL